MIAKISTSINKEELDSSIKKNMPKQNSNIKNKLTTGNKSIADNSNNFDNSKNIPNKNKLKIKLPEQPLPPPPKKRIMKLSELFKERAEKKKASQQKKIEPEYVLKERSIGYSNKDAIFTSIKTGFTESFIMPYAIAMNAGTSFLVALSSVPQLLASFLQLFSQNSLRFFKSRSKLIFITALIQSLMWLPILAIPFIAKDNFWLLLMLISLETIFGTFQGPVYNSILGDIIDESKRGEVLGRRNSIINLMSFITTFLAGLILTAFKNMDQNNTVHYVFYGYAILFAIAFISRLIASFYKAKIYDPPFKPVETKTNFFGFIKNMTHDNYGIFVMYVFLYKFAASISSPFFELYLLRDLHNGYIYFTLITIISIVAGFLSLNLWGRLIDKYGSKKILTIAGFLQPLSPFLLFLAIYIKDPVHLLIYLLLEEAFSGAAWSAFNLSTSSFLFDATSKEERIKHISYYNFIIGIGIFLGALFGGLLIKIFPVFVVSAIPLIYLTSGFLRLGSTIFMIKRVREAKLVEVTILNGGFFPRILSIRPQFGNTIEIIGTNHKKPNGNGNSVKTVQKNHTEIVTKEEKTFYEHKSLDYVKENAMKTLDKNQNSADASSLNNVSDTNNIDSKQYRKKISELTQEIKKKNMLGKNKK